MKKLLSYLLILTGIVLIAFPVAREWHYDQKQKRLLDSIEKNPAPSTAGDSDKLLEESYKHLSDLFSQEAAAAEPEPVSEDTDDQKGIGVISIDRINAKLPILEGATTENMKYAAVHLTETSPLGEVGNAAIAAHRAHTKGRLFNRLGEVEIGDKITVQIKDQLLEYSVFKILRVKPTDLSVLKGNKVDRELTLITCDPLVNPYQRLIVQAKM